MIIEYTEKYKEDCKDLLVELEEYICSIDKDHLDQLHPEYREKMFDKDLKEVEENNGKAYLVVEHDKAVGLIMGCIRKFDELDYLDYKCPKTGEVTELIVSKTARKKGYGKQLMDQMEKYLQELGCEYISIDVFAYNQNAIHFYEQGRYHNRMHIMIKKINESNDV